MKNKVSIVIIVLLVCFSQSILIGKMNNIFVEEIEEKKSFSSTFSDSSSNQSPFLPLLLNISEEDFEYPHLSLSGEFNYYIPRNFSLVVTAFSTIPVVTVSCEIFDFYTNITYQLNSYTQTYFVNQKLFFNASVLQMEQQYNMTLFVFDQLGRNNSITRTVEIDPIVPKIIDIVISESRLYYGETIIINYLVEEDHLRGVYLFIEGRDSYLTVSHRKEGELNVEYYFFDLPGGFTQYQFDCKIMARDFAGNNVNESFTLTYIDDRREGLSRDEQNALILSILGKVGLVGLVDLAFFIVSLLVVSNFLDKKGVG